MKSIIVTLMFCACFQNINGRKGSKGCKINLNSDLNEGNAPVFFTRKSSRLELLFPQLVDGKGVFKLSKDESLFVACPGNRNELRGFTSDENKPLQSKCVEGKSLHLKGKNVTSSALECKSKVKAEMKEKNTPCGNRNGKEIQLGFEVEDWHPLVTICYHQDRTETLYSTHTLYGSVLQGAETKAHQSYFVKGSQRIFAGVNPEKAYKQTSQREVLRQLLGETRSDYFLKTSFLSRGHLSPDADFLLGTWQELTYFYVNTAPQWQAINVGNWLRVENLIRKFASQAKEDFTVTTGTYGVLELEDSNEVPQKIFLEPNKNRIPVPLVFWKVVEDVRNNACIVFLVHNNPFLESSSLRELPICKNICKDHGWPSDMDNISKGISYCCSFSDFRKTVDYAPHHRCSTVLKNHS